MSGRRPIRRLSGFMGAALLVVVGLFTLFPFWWMLSTSFKPAKEVFTTGIGLIPRNPVLSNYVQAFTGSLLWRYLLNGVIVTMGILSLQLLVTVPAAFALARVTFPARDRLFSLIIAALVFPGFIAAIPNFLLVSSLRLTDTYTALIAPFVGSAYGIFLFRQFFRSVPQDFLDAAAIDGCSIPSMLWHVVFPLSLPAVGGFSIISILTHWNDFFWPLVVVQSNRMLTPPAGVVHFAGPEGDIQYGAVMAAAAVIVLPLIAAFLAARRLFFENLSEVQLK